MEGEENSEESNGDLPRYRSISNLDLARYKRPDIPGRPRFFIRAIWYIVNVLFFKNALLGLLPSSWKSSVLRCFGANIGTGLVCKPSVSIKSPWFLEIGDHVWLGENAWIDNHCQITVGSNSCISQGVYIFTGNHDWAKETFDYFSKPVMIGEGVWVAAFSTVYPGEEIPSHVVVRAN